MVMKEEKDEVRNEKDSEEIIKTNLSPGSKFEYENQIWSPWPQSCVGPHPSL